MIDKDGNQFDGFCISDKRKEELFELFREYYDRYIKGHESNIYEVCYNISNDKDLSDFEKVVFGHFYGANCNAGFINLCMGLPYYEKDVIIQRSRKRMENDNDW